jgi:hypothetical protein
MGLPANTSWPKGKPSKVTTSAMHADSRVTARTFTHALRPKECGPFAGACAKCSSPPEALLKTHPDSLNRVDEGDAVENALPPPTGCSPSSRIPRPDRVSAITRAIDQSARRPGSGSELATRRRNHCRIVSEARSSPPLTRKNNASRGETLSAVTSWYQPAVIAKNG